MATDTHRISSGTPDVLKVTPPRVPRHLLARPRLQSGHEELRDRPVILVQAPAGFGKTSLAAQWRLEHLARGRLVRVLDQEWPAEWSYWAVAPQGHMRRPAVRDFVEWLKVQAVGPP